MKFYSLKCFINPIEVDRYNKTSGKNIVDEMSAAFILRASFKETLIVKKTFSGFELLLFDEKDIDEKVIDELLDLCKEKVSVMLKQCCFNNEIQ